MARTLIVRYAQLGDIVMLLPTLNALAKQYPEDEFIVLTHPKFSKVFELMPPNISLYPMTYRKPNIPLRGLVYIFHRYRRVIKLFMAKKFDKVAFMQNGKFDDQLQYLLSLRGSEIAKTDLSYFFSQDKIRDCLIKQTSSLLELSVETLSRLGYKNLKAEFDLSHYTNSDRQKEILEVVGLNDENKKLIGIAPFSRMQAKIYPLDKMEKIVAYYSKREDVQVVILGGGIKENIKYQEWKKSYPQISSLINKLSFDEEISALSTFKAVISMDSLNMHLAAFVGTPVISIWGPGDPLLGFYPVTETKEHAIRRELNCRPCSLCGEVPCTNPRLYECMNIDPQLIIDKVNNLIDASV